MDKNDLHFDCAELEQDLEDKSPAHREPGSVELLKRDWVAMYKALFGE